MKKYILALLILLFSIPAHSADNRNYWQTGGNPFFLLPVGDDYSGFHFGYWADRHLKRSEMETMMMEPSPLTVEGSVTVDAGTETFTWVGHPLRVHDVITFEPETGGTLPSPLYSETEMIADVVANYRTPAWSKTPYWVRDVTANTFTITGSFVGTIPQIPTDCRGPNGSGQQECRPLIDITDTGTGTFKVIRRGNRTCIVDGTNGRDPVWQQDNFADWTYFYNELDQDFIDNQDSSNMNTFKTINGALQQCDQYGDHILLHAGTYYHEGAFFNYFSASSTDLDKKRIWNGVGFGPVGDGRVIIDHSEKENLTGGSPGNRWEIDPLNSSVYRTRWPSNREGGLGNYLTVDIANDYIQNRSHSTAPLQVGDLVWLNFEFYAPPTGLNNYSMHYVTAVNGNQFSVQNHLKQGTIDLIDDGDPTHPGPQNFTNASWVRYFEFSVDPSTDTFTVESPDFLPLAEGEPLVFNISGFTGGRESSGSGGGGNITVDETTDRVSMTDFPNHGYINGTKFQYQTTGALPTGMSENTTYYVVNRTDTDFQLSLTDGGSPINITDQGSGTHRTAGGCPAPLGCGFTGGAPFYYVTQVSGNTFKVKTDPTNSSVLDITSTGDTNRILMYRHEAHRDTNPSFFVLEPDTYLDYKKWRPRKSYSDMVTSGTFGLGPEGYWYHDAPNGYLYVNTGGLDPDNYDYILSRNTQATSMGIAGTDFLHVYGIELRGAGGHGMTFDKSSPPTSGPVGLLGENVIAGYSGKAPFDFADGDLTIINRGLFGPASFQMWPIGRFYSGGGWSANTGTGSGHYRMGPGFLYNSLIEDSGGEGLACFGQNQDADHSHTIIRGNVVRNNYSVELYLTQSHNLLVEENLVYKSRADYTDMWDYFNGYAEGILGTPNGHENGYLNQLDFMARRYWTGGILFGTESTSPVDFSKNVEIRNNVIVNTRFGTSQLVQGAADGQSEEVYYHNNLWIAPVTNPRVGPSAVGSDRRGIEILGRPLDNNNVVEDNYVIMPNIGGINDTPSHPYRLPNIHLYRNNTGANFGWTFTDNKFYGPVESLYDSGQGDEWGSFWHAGEAMDFTTYGTTTGDPWTNNVYLQTVPAQVDVTVGGTMVVVEQFLPIGATGTLTFESVAGACSTQIVSDGCTYPYSFDQTTVTGCNDGYTGVCGATCDNGTWTSTSDTCVQSCDSGSSSQYCRWGDTAHNGTYSGCIWPATGTCSGTCNNGTFDNQIDTCAVPPPGPDCSETTNSAGCVLPQTADQTLATPGCQEQYVGTCNAECHGSGGFQNIEDTCVYEPFDPCPGGGFNDNHLTFNSNNFNAATAITDMGIQTYPFSMSTRFRTSATNTRMATIGMMEGASTTAFYDCGLHQGRAAIWATNTNFSGEILDIGTQTFNDGEWHNMVCVFESDTSRKVYVDGVLQATGTGSVPFENSTSLFVIGKGTNVSSTHFFTGDIKNAKVWNIALDQSQVTTLETASVSTGLQAEWRMQDGSGTSVTDAINTYNLVLNSDQMWFVGAPICVWNEGNHNDTYSGCSTGYTGVCSGQCQGNPTSTGQWINQVNTCVPDTGGGGTGPLSPIIHRIRGGVKPSSGVIFK
jgi:hypothetical protein